MQIVKNISDSTGVLSTLFSIVAMTAASVFLWFRPGTFHPDHWLEALGTCALLVGGVVAKRTFDNSKLAKNGTGEEGKP